MASLKEVAEKAGVSVSTVSYVLNGKKKVKEETLERIRAAVEETGYVTNTLARSLREGRSRLIGLIIPNAIEYTWEDIVTGAERCLEPKGYHVVCSICRNDALREEKSVANFLELKVDGIILVGISDPDRIRALAGDLPVVYVERTLSDRYSYVDMDYRKVAGIAVRHLFDCGKRNVGLITGPFRYQSSALFVEGARRELRELGLGADSAPVAECDYTLEAGAEAMKRLLSSGKPVDGVAAFNDRIAAGAIQALHARGLGIPEDVAVIGHNDYPFCKAIFPSLSSVRKDSEKMGYLASGILLRKIGDPEAAEEQYKLEPPGLSVRSSTVRETVRE